MGCPAENRKYNIIHFDVVNEKTDKITGHRKRGEGNSEQTTSRCFALSFSGRKESGIIFF